MTASGVAVSDTPSYAEVSDIVEALVNIEGRRTPIPGMDFEDTAQEVRMECVRVLQFYDATRIGPSPFKYLQTCVRNFLYNQRRGIWVPNNPPCVRCPLWDKMKKTTSLLVALLTACTACIACVATTPMPEDVVLEETEAQVLAAKFYVRINLKVRQQEIEQYPQTWAAMRRALEEWSQHVPVHFKVYTRRSTSAARRRRRGRSS